MNSLLAKALLFSAILALPAAAHAQGVYVTQGEKGTVFSDKPQPGAKEVILPPLTIIAPPQENRSVTVAPAAPAPLAGSTPPGADTTAYRSFTVILPENDGSVVANAAVFEVRVAVDPPLQLGERHSIVVSINGRRVAQRFTAPEFMIPPEFWGDVLPPANQSMQLDASIVDGNGQVLKKASPVRFFLRHTTIYNHPRRPPPPQNVPQKMPTVKPTPELEPASRSALKRSN